MFRKLTIKYAKGNFLESFNISAHLTSELPLKESVFT